MWTAPGTTAATPEAPLRRPERLAQHPARFGATGLAGALALAAAALVSTPAAAADLDLSPGDDLVTLMSGLAPGDEAVLRGGTYVIEATIALEDLAGTESAPIRVRAAGEATPVIQRVGGGAVFRVRNSSHVIIEGLTLRGGEGWQEVGNSGVRVDGDSAHVTLRDLDIADMNGTLINMDGNGRDHVVTRNHLHDTLDGHGIYAGCGDGGCWLQDSLIADNWIHDLGADWSVGILLRRGSHSNTIVDNVVHGLPNRGIEIAATAQGPGNVVEGNAIWNMGREGIFVGGSATVRNNVVFDTIGNGIRSDDDVSDDFDDVVISFNTVVRSVDDGIQIIDWGGRTGMVLANNVVSNPTGYALEVQGEGFEGAYVSGNVLTGLVRGLEELEGHFVPGNGSADFVDAVGWDYYPSGSSTLADSADPSGAAFIPEVDFNGLAREGDAPDVGAYERSAAANPGWTLQEGFKQPPPPALDDEEVGGCDCESGGGEAAAFLPLVLLGGLARRRRGLTS